jgi:malonyl-CoA O-methyltransferase
MSRWFARRRESTGSALTPSAAYALWAPDYRDEPHNALMRVEQAAMLDLLPDVTGKVVLDVACGTGRYLRLLEAGGAARIVGLDLAQEMLARVRRGRAALVRSDLRGLPFARASIDVAVCALALNDIAALGLAIAEIGRVLRPTGCLVYSVLHPRGGPLGWSRTFETADGPQTVITCWHSRAAHDLACARAGLTIDAVLEPRLPSGIVNPPDGPVALVVRGVKDR